MAIDALERDGEQLGAQRTELRGPAEDRDRTREAEALMHELATLAERRDALDDQELESLEEQSRWPTRSGRWTPPRRRSRRRPRDAAAALAGAGGRDRRRAGRHRRRARRRWCRASTTPRSPATSGCGPASAASPSPGSRAAGAAGATSTCRRGELEQVARRRRRASSPTARSAGACSCPDRSPMFLWFIGTAIVTVWYVFRDPRVRLPPADRRVGAAAGRRRDRRGRRAAHAACSACVLLVVVMLSTVGRRPVRKLLLGLPIGTHAAPRLRRRVDEHRRVLVAARRVVVRRRPAAGGGAGPWWDLGLELVGLALLRVGLAPLAPRGPGRAAAASCATAACSSERAGSCGTLTVVLILVRHGRTALNAAGRLQGRIDEPLDDVGHLQAKAVAERVGPVDELITSPLLRAQQTADAFGVPYEVDERWIELAYGVYEGCRPATCRRRLAALARGPGVRARGRRVAGRPRPAGSGRRASTSPSGPATGRSSSCRTCRRSRRRSAGRSARRSSMSWRSHLSQASICRIDIRRAGPVLFTFNEAPLPG